MSQVDSAAIRVSAQQKYQSVVLCYEGKSIETIVRTAVHAQAGDIVCFGRQVVGQNGTQNNQNGCFRLQYSLGYNKGSHSSQDGEIHGNQLLHTKDKSCALRWLRVVSTEPTPTRTHSANVIAVAWVERFTINRHRRSLARTDKGRGNTETAALEFPRKNDRVESQLPAAPGWYTLSAREKSGEAESIQSGFARLFFLAGVPIFRERDVYTYKLMGLSSAVI